jgi:cytochrome c
MNKMKKTILLFSLVAAISSCGNNNESKTDNAARPAEETSAKAENPEVEKGLNLVAKSDCLTCHQIETKATGPAYIDVAAKYPSNDAVIDSLSDKIIKGGAGNWGTIPMVAHPQVSKDDAKAMVTYILSLKKQ